MIVNYYYKTGDKDLVYGLLDYIVFEGLFVFLSKSVMHYLYV